MKRLTVVLTLLFWSAQLLAANSYFGLDAFNRAVSAATKSNAVFSPVAFEFDSVIFSEAFDTLVRAKYAERMGVLNGLENVYRPKYDRLTDADGRGFRFLSAFAFFVRDQRKSNILYRKWMQDAFSAEVHSFESRHGAERWFHAKMNGEMEDFALDTSAVCDGFYSFYNLVSISCSWVSPFPTSNTRDIKFKCADGSFESVSAMCDLRIADVWERKKDVIIRLPLKDDAWFYALMPSEDVELRNARDAISSATIQDILTGFKSVTELGVTHGPTAIVLPLLDVMSESDLKLPFSYFRLSLDGMTKLEAESQPRRLRQLVRFHLDETGYQNTPVAEKPSDELVKASKETKRIALNRPFLFFIYHEPTETIPIVGQYTGR